MDHTRTRQHEYIWTGQDNQGRRLQGRLSGPNAAMVRAKLRRQQIQPWRVYRQRRWLGRFSQQQRRIKTADIALFSRQLATMIAADIDLTQALTIIAQGSTHARLRQVVQALRADIESGRTLADALANHPRHFDDLFVNLVAAGEYAGALQSLLERLATYQEQTAALGRRIRQALFYPMLVLLVALTVVILLLYFVVPQFQTLFADFGADLPAFTQLVIALSQLLQQHGWLLLALITALAVGFVIAWRRWPGLQRLMDQFMLRLPIIGPLIRHACVSRFASTLATMTAAGIALVEALDATADVIGNQTFKDSVHYMRRQVETGQRLATALAQTTCFPAMMQQMIQVGEESGRLEAMCTRVADFYATDVQTRTDHLAALLEPFIMLVIGGLTGGLIIAMYLPIFGIGSVV